MNSELLAAALGAAVVMLEELFRHRRERARRRRGQVRSRWDDSLPGARTPRGRVDEL